MNKILVIGATGHVGSRLVPQLLEREAVVKAATRTPETYNIAHPGVTPVYFNYDLPETFQGALADVDRIFMLALPADPIAHKRLAPFIDAAQAASVRHIVMMTAVGVEFAEESPLRQVETYIEASGIEYTFLRPNWFMDNFSTGFLHPMITEAKGIFIPAEDAKSSFIAAQDIASVAAVVLTEPEHQGRAYTLTGGEALTYYEAADVLSDVIGESIQYAPATDEALRQNLKNAGAPADQIAIYSALFAAVRAGGTALITPDVEQLLERRPLTFNEFAQANANRWQ